MNITMTEIEQALKNVGAKILRSPFPGVFESDFTPKPRFFETLIKIHLGNLRLAEELAKLKERPVYIKDGGEISAIINFSQQKFPIWMEGTHYAAHLLDPTLIVFFDLDSKNKDVYLIDQNLLLCENSLDYYPLTEAEKEEMLASTKLHA